MDQQFLNIRILTGLQLPLTICLEVLIDINPISEQSKVLEVAFGGPLLEGHLWGGGAFGGGLWEGAPFGGGLNGP